MLSSILLQSGPRDASGLIFFLLAVNVALVIWTYKDAQKNSNQSEVLWALVVFFAPLLGIVLYFLLGRENR